MQTAVQHYLRTPDGAVYGPANMATLCTWATDARIIPGCELSEDRAQWMPAAMFPALRLNWTVQFNDGTTYGPLNLLAIWALAAENSIPRGTALREHGTARAAVLDESLLPLLVDECRQVLSSCGSLVGEAIAGLAHARHASEARRVAQDARLDDWRLKLERAESDLAVSLKLVAETQRRLAESEASATRERQATKAELQAARETLQAAETKLQASGKALQEEQGKRQAVTNELERLKEELHGVRGELQAREKALLDRDAGLAAVREEAARKEAGLAARLAEVTETLKKGQDQWQRDSALLESLRASEKTARQENRDLKAGLEAKDREIARWGAEAADGRARAAEQVSALEAQLAELAPRQAETAKKASGLEARVAVLERDLQQARQEAEERRGQLAEARQEAAKARQAGLETEIKLRDEREAIQSDLNRLMLASQTVEQVARQPGPAAIDWMKASGPDPDPSGVTTSDAARFAALSLPAKMAILHKELQSSAGQKELLRREVETLKGRYEYLQKEAARKERDAEEKLAQIRKEVETSSELLTRTLHEVERRESQLRDLRKKSGTVMPGEEGHPPVLEAEVIHAEVLGPAEPVAGAGREHGPAPAPEPPSARAQGRVLDRVEAQVQQELRKWEALRREKLKPSGTLGHWFRRKKP